MTKAISIFILATILLFKGLSFVPAYAADNSDCQMVYGGQVCGQATPPIEDTSIDPNLMLNLSLALYTLGGVALFKAGK